jgi:hypothetical protein
MRGLGVIFMKPISSWASMKYMLLAVACIAVSGCDSWRTVKGEIVAPPGVAPTNCALLIAERPDAKQPFRVALSKPTFEELILVSPLGTDDPESFWVECEGFVSKSAFAKYKESLHDPLDLGRFYLEPKK